MPARSRSIRGWAPRRLPGPPALRSTTPSAPARPRRSWTCCAATLVWCAPGWWSAWARHRPVRRRGHGGAGLPLDGARGDAGRGRAPPAPGRGAPGRELEAGEVRGQQALHRSTTAPKGTPSRPDRWRLCSPAAGTSSGRTGRRPPACRGWRCTGTSSGAPAARGRRRRSGGPARGRPMVIRSPAGRLLTLWSRRTVRPRPGGGATPATRSVVGAGGGQRGRMRAARGKGGAPLWSDGVRVKRCLGAPPAE